MHYLRGDNIVPPRRERFVTAEGKHVEYYLCVSLISAESFVVILLLQLGISDAGVVDSAQLFLEDVLDVGNVFEGDRAFFEISL